MNRVRKAAILIIAAVIVAGMILSCLFILTSSSHQCCGEDCPVCFAVSLCSKLFSELSFIAVLLCFLNFTKAEVGSKKAKSDGVISFSSPVILHTRLTC